MNATTQSKPLTRTEKIANAAKTAEARMYAWCRVQMRAQEKAQAAKAAGDARGWETYFGAQCSAAAHRTKHERALERLDRMARGVD